MKEKSDIYIVGIGASEGGLVAINQFFKTVPSNTGIAFIICEYLALNNKEHLAEIISHNAHLKVNEITQGMCIEENNIYLVPKNKEVEIKEDVFVLFDKDKHTHIIIDRLFHSLAKEKKHKAIGIILSGIGKDGSKGICTINKEKGLVIVQNEDTAEFVEKPRNAAATGVVDYVLPPSKMIEVILRHIDKEDAPYELLQSQNSEEAFYKIIDIVKENIGIDLLAYKKTTITRRIEQRMNTLEITNLEDYFKFLKQYPNEINVLFYAIYVGVTKFFRDTEAFKVIEDKVIPNLFKDKEDGVETRIWIPGCSTGEEVYSILILIEEYFERLGRRHLIKIIATDINEKSLEHASKGIYSKECILNISDKRRQKFFRNNANEYYIDENLRNKVIFLKHDLLKDIPFSNLDFIICRNLLIYLDNQTQQSVLSKFHFSLNHNGYLFLGKSETIGKMRKYFEIEDIKWKIYKYAQKDVVAKVNNYDSSRFKEYQQKNGDIANGNIRIKKYSKQQIITETLDEIGKMYIPKGVIINESYELIHAIGDVNDYISAPLSKMSLNLFELIRRDLSIPVGIAVNSALKENKLSRYKNIRLKKENEYKEINLSVIPFKNLQIDEIYFGILFEDCGSTVGCIEDNIFTDEKIYERIYDLERELSYNKEHLHEVIEELEVSNEELILSNEELLNINEELQSVNVELHMINYEYQTKLEELRQANEYIKKLINVPDVNIIRVDKEICIREITPNISRIMDFRDSDIGRVPYNLGKKLNYIHLFKDIQEVLIHLNEKEEIIENSEGKVYKVKITPHLNELGLVVGAFINLIDITNMINDNCLRDKLQKLMVKEIVNE